MKLTVHFDVTSPKVFCFTILPQKNKKVNRGNAKLFWWYDKTLIFPAGRALRLKISHDKINAITEGTSDFSGSLLSVFDGLEETHHQMEPLALKKAMLEIGYHAVKTL